VSAREPPSHILPERAHVARGRRAMAPSVELPQIVLAALAPAISAHTRANYRRANDAAPGDIPASREETSNENVSLRDDPSASTSAPSARSAAPPTFEELMASVLGGDGSGGGTDAAAEALSAAAWEAAGGGRSSSGDEYARDDFESIRSEQSTSPSVTSAETETPVPSSSASSAAASSSSTAGPGRHCSPRLLQAHWTLVSGV